MNSKANKNREFNTYWGAKETAQPELLALTKRWKHPEWGSEILTNICDTAKSERKCYKETPSKLKRGATNVTKHFNTQEQTRLQKKMAEVGYTVELSNGSNGGNITFLRYQWRSLVPEPWGCEWSYGTQRNRMRNNLYHNPVLKVTWSQHLTIFQRPFLTSTTALNRLIDWNYIGRL